MNEEERLKENQVMMQQADHNQLIRRTLSITLSIIYIILFSLAILTTGSIRIVSLTILGIIYGLILLLSSYIIYNTMGCKGMFCGLGYIFAGPPCIISTIGFIRIIYVLANN